MQGAALGLVIFIGILGGYWVLVFLFMLLGNCSCFQVREREASVKETCGKQGVQLGPGWYCLCPIAQRRREYEYKYYTTNGLNQNLQEIKGKQLIVPLQQQSLDYPAFEVITRDNVQCYLDLTITFSITNASQMLYSVTNLPYMIEKLVNALVRQRAGQLDLDRIIEDPSQISRLQAPLQEEAHRWGVVIHLLKVQKVEASNTLKQALSLAKQTELDNQIKLKQVSTDRHTGVIKAQGERDRLIKEAEGRAQQMIMNGKGMGEQIRNQARAEAQAIRELSSRGMGPEATFFQIQQKYLDVLEKIVRVSTQAGYYRHDADAAEAAKLIGVTISSGAK